MTDHLRQIANDLSRDLDLDQPMVQVTYLDEVPKGVTQHPGGVPSVCTFFAEGQKKPFYAALPAHEACEIGAFVLGAAPEGELGARLMATVGMMQKEGYLRPGEEAKIPRNATAPKYVAYGPLGSLPMPPTNILFFARPKSAMLAMEAASGPVPMNGRPMCAIVPTLNQGAAVAVSMGCVGSRVFTQMADDRMLVGIRGDHLDSFHSAVQKIAHANRLVGAEDLRRRETSERPYSP
ncbi:MAG: DUF169 domain-containing protein [Thermoplasmata archaeon]|nr:DUF169 domain-containing protein [Thermoplasmata archaeon]MCI4328765.1 DUF169 domain-containing protein [Thermoplasmata archaeon]MCI4332178.1 DUF169 domain-containing protein [Thermoplasmata archaeon]